MGIEAVRHSSDHDAGDEDNHSKGNSATVTGELCPARGSSQLAFADQGDGGYHTVIVITLLCGCGVSVLWGAQDLFDRFGCHLDSLQTVRSQARAGTAQHALHRAMRNPSLHTWRAESDCLGCPQCLMSQTQAEPGSGKKVSGFEASDVAV